VGWPVAHKAKSSGRIGTVGQAGERTDGGAGPSEQESGVAGA